MRHVVAVAPLVAGVIVAVVLGVAGERRELLIGTPLPLLIGLVGALVSGIALAVLLLVRSGRRGAARVAAAHAEGVAAGAAAERDAHRRFLSRLDHELKNPVTAIRATVAGLGDEDPALAIVDDQARRLATLVGDLRELAELETRPLDLEPVDLERVVQDAVAAVAQQRPEAAARLSVTVDRVPWPIPELMADPDLLGLAVENVVGNAAKFSADGPIEVRLREDGGHAVVEVADAGRGVPLDAVDAVFDELARAGNARDVPGSGIGLALVRTILRQHGGDVSLRSREGAGTVVTLRLPVVGVTSSGR